MSGGDVLLPYSLRGLPVRIHPLSKTELRQIFSQTFSSFKPIYSNFEFGTLVLSRGVTAPTITPAEAAGLEPQVFTAILSRILEISGVGLKRKETRYLVESLPDDAKVRQALELTKETLTQSGFVGLFDQFVLSGRFAEAISKWQTYDLKRGSLGWDRLSKRRRNTLIKENQLAAVTEGASTIIKSDGERQWVTVVVDYSKVSEPSDLEHFTLHEGQHVIDSILGYGRTYAADEKTILKMLRSRGVRTNTAFVRNTLDVINEVFVERRIYHLRGEESLKFMARQIEHSKEFMLDPRLLVKSGRGAKVVAALGLYVLERLVVVSAPFREAGKQRPSALEEVFRRFPSVFRDYHERLLCLIGGLSLEQVKPSDIVSTAILLKEFYEKYRRSLASKRTGNR